MGRAALRGPGEKAAGKVACTRDGLPRNLTSGGASEPQAPKACAASPIPRGATSCDRRELFHPFDIGHSSSFHCSRSECAESFLRIWGRAGHSVRERPCPCETP